MHPKYPRIFSPIKLGPIELSNRFYMSPHSVPMAVGTKPSDDFIHYYVARVKGGCGLVMLAATLHGRARIFQPSPHPKENIGAFRALADAVHEAGGRIFAEPYYQWAVAGQWQPLSPPAPAFGPSPVQYRSHEKGFVTREITRREIGMMLGALRQSIEHLREAGYDGVMIHGAHGALAEHFLSPYFNRRTDEYGGTLENRMRFLIESLQVAREAAGDRMAVGMRFNCDELLSGGYDSKEAYRVLHSISQAGLIDYADLDVATEPQQYYIGMPAVFMNPHLYRPYVEAVRGAAGKIPVLSVLGRMTSIADAQAMIAAGVCDMVGAARGLIAEPDLVRNAFEGKEERSRTCIACNWCMAGIADGSAGCAINPVSYRERLWGPDAPAPRRSKVIVVGAGPGGLEAARTSALRGHEVTVIEARTRVGGAFALWAGLPGRGAYQLAIDWWSASSSASALLCGLERGQPPPKSSGKNPTPSCWRPAPPTIAAAAGSTASSIYPATTGTSSTARKRSCRDPSFPAARSWCSMTRDCKPAWVSPSCSPGMALTSSFSHRTFCPYPRV